MILGYKFHILGMKTTLGQHIAKNLPVYKFGESKWNPCWLIMLTSSSGTNYVLNEHDDVDQYSSFAIPSEIMLYQSHPESLVNQNEIPIDLAC